MFVSVSMIVPKSEKKTSIYGKMFNSRSSSGRQVLNFLEVVKASRTFFDKSKISNL